MLTLQFKQPREQNFGIQPQNLHHRLIFVKLEREVHELGENLQQKISEQSANENDLKFSKLELRKTKKTVKKRCSALEMSENKMKYVQKSMEVWSQKMKS
jgi:hypothetical protein